MCRFPNAHAGVAKEPVDLGGHEDNGARRPVPWSLLRAIFGPNGVIVERIAHVDGNALVRSNRLEVVALEFLKLKDDDEFLTAAGTRRELETRRYVVLVTS